MSAKRKSRKGKWIVISILTVAMIGIGATLLMRPTPTAYESVVAEIGDIATYYSFSGNVTTKNRQTVVSSKLMQVAEIKVKEGDAIKRDTVLIKTTTGDQIKSKISGEVANITVEENAQIMAGTKLLEIVNYNNLEVDVKVDEYDITALEKGKEASVKIGAINKEINGKISSMSKEGQIVNGVTYFTATIDLKKDEKGVTVKTEIVTGINDGTTVEVKSGVLKGETILYTKAKTEAPGGMGLRGGGSGGSSNNASSAGGGN